MLVQKNCEACGALISVRLVDHKRGWGRFCDKACAAAHKTGQRPGDVNANHAKSSAWAADRLQARDAAGGSWLIAPSVKSQVGKVKVRAIYHSPSECRSCGKSINGRGLCGDCEAHEEGLRAAIARATQPASDQ